MLKHCSFLFAFSLSTLACTQETALPRLVEAPLPDTATLQVDSAFVSADDWYFSGETDAIYLLRGDSLFASPAKPLRWQYLGADPAWRGRTIFRVYNAGKGIAVLFTCMDPETEVGKAPVLWFSGKKPIVFSPATPVTGHRWQLIPEPVFPGNSGCFLYLHQDSLDWETRNSPFDSTAIYWLSLTGRTLTRLPFSQKPEFYDTSMRYAFFQTGHRRYPEENQFYPTFHRFDTYSGKIEAGVPDLRLKEPWCVFNTESLEGPCLIEQWSRQKNGTGIFFLEMRFDGLHLPDGRFVRLHLPPRKEENRMSGDSIMTDAFINQTALSRENLIFTALGSLFQILLKEGATAENLTGNNYLYDFGIFPNGNGYSYNQTIDDPTDYSFQTGTLFLYNPSKNTRMDLFKHLRRPASNPIYREREVISLNMMEIAGFQPTSFRLLRIRQGFLVKKAGRRGENPALDQYLANIPFPEPEPFPKESIDRHAFLYQDGHLTLVDLSFLGKHESDFQTLLFHPSGAILARDWRSGNLRWWGFKVP